ncbi:hypothetical protein PVAP13_1KG437805 [Panicum virgatum]|uniref:Uncharacterized protein n=1 Tax=Panicum virgatum TaxID=38727 RepID=A0A8T0XMT1_PANVG|nr:hypothetical protein PVAP13_1KG437805 [Panicum virgatum]
MTCIMRFCCHDWVPPLPRNCILPPLSFLCVVSNHRLLILLTGCARIKKLMLTLLSAQKFYM